MARPGGRGSPHRRAGYRATASARRVSLRPFICVGQADCLLLQIPAYHAYPSFAGDCPEPVPKPSSESVTTIRLMDFTLL